MISPSPGRINSTSLSHLGMKFKEWKQKVPFATGDKSRPTKSCLLFHSLPEENKPLPVGLHNDIR
jgi:hypothetical protein